MNVKVIALVLALLMVVGGGVLAESTQLNKNSDSSILENNEAEKGQAEVTEDSSYVPDHAAERKEWSDSGEEGPPPWANGRGNRNSNTVNEN